MADVQRSAGGIVLGDSGTIALVRNRPGTKWFFPKGGVGGNESDEDAARREITEETGLTDLDYIDDLGRYERPHILPDGSYDPQKLKDIHMYLFAAPMHAPLLASHEIEETTWMPLPQVVAQLEDPKDRAWFATVFERVRQAVQRD